MLQSGSADKEGRPGVVASGYLDLDMGSAREQNDECGSLVEHRPGSEQARG
jgi:hypothetical protein